MHNIIVDFLMGILKMLSRDATKDIKEIVKHLSVKTMKR